MDKYQDFFDSIKKYITYRDEEITSGKNDYNMVNVVRKENAEVGMHSNVIYSLIDPNGQHYRGDLFLKLFIKYVLADEKIKIDDFGEIISVKAEESTIENRRIDFTIKSTKYYIGIEMKIDAKDLSEQLSHYEYDLLLKAKNDKVENVIIYYLTKDGKEAATHSSNKIDYKKRSFEKHILNWIENCQNEVKNITNLNLAFENYKDIVKKITGKYKGNLMPLEEFLKGQNVSEFYTVFNEIDEMQERVNRNFINTLDGYLGTIEGKDKKSSYIDIAMGEYVIRLYFTGSELMVQIGDEKDRFTKSISEERRDSFFNNYNSASALSNKKWDKGYGERNLGKVRLQTQLKLLEDAAKFINEFRIN